MWQVLTTFCRGDHERVKSQVEKQRQRADRAERALEPLRHNIRQLTAEVEAKADEIRVVRNTTIPGSRSCTAVLQERSMYTTELQVVP